MELITRQLLANKAAEEWRNTYFNGESWESTIDGDAEIVYNKLVALGGSPHPNAVDSIIGNNTWTKLECESCHSNTSALIKFDLPHNDDEVQICADCIERAYCLVQVAKEVGKS